MPQRGGEETVQTVQRRSIAVEAQTVAEAISAAQKVADASLTTADGQREVVRVEDGAHNLLLIPGQYAWPGPQPDFGKTGK